MKGKDGARKDKYPSDNEEEEEEGEQGEETIPKQGNPASVAEALADTQAELEAQGAIPSAVRRVARSVRIVRNCKATVH